MLQKTRLLLLCLSLWAGGAAYGQQTRSFEQMQQAAQRGDAEAQMALAQTYDAGIGVAQDFSRAAHWFRAAAKQGNTQAQNRLGKYLQSGLGGEQDNARAFDWLSRAARDGNPEHLADLALMYENGLGVPQDFAKAARLYERAQQQGLLRASTRLGVLYQNGTGVAQDFTKAHDLYLAPAKAGDAQAQNNLGLLYVRGSGVAQDYKQAVFWFEKAAQTGLAPALRNLGVMYENGFGVPQDDDTAKALYKRAGLHLERSLGALLEQTGFVTDPRLNLPPLTPESLQRQQDAAVQGDPVAQFFVAYLLLLAPQSDPFEGAKWLQLAARKGLPVAQANLGLLYFRGLGVPQDYVSGYMWLTRAATTNQADLVRLRNDFRNQITPAQINEAQALARQ